MINTNVLLLQFSGVSPLINRPGRVAKSSTTTTDHMLTNTIKDSEAQSSIIKTDMRDNFPVFALTKTSLVQPNMKESLYKSRY